jgi:hypothetical protein
VQTPDGPGLREAKPPTAALPDRDDVDAADAETDAIREEARQQPRRAATLREGQQLRTRNLGKKRAQMGIIEFERAYTAKLRKDAQEAHGLGLLKAAQSLAASADRFDKVTDAAEAAAARAGHESAAQKVLMDWHGGDWRGPDPKPLGAKSARKKADHSDLDVLDYDQPVMDRDWQAYLDSGDTRAKHARVQASLEGVTKAIKAKETEIAALKAKRDPLTRSEQLRLRDLERRLVHNKDRRHDLTLRQRYTARKDGQLGAGAKFNPKDSPEQRREAFRIEYDTNANKIRRNRAWLAENRDKPQAQRDKVKAENHDLRERNEAIEAKLGTPDGPDLDVEGLRDGRDETNVEKGDSDHTGGRRAAKVITGKGDERHIVDKLDDAGGERQAPNPDPSSGWHKFDDEWHQFPPGTSREDALAYVYGQGAKPEGKRKIALKSRADVEAGAKAKTATKPAAAAPQPDVDQVAEQVREADQPSEPPQPPEPVARAIDPNSTARWEFVNPDGSSGGRVTLPELQRRYPEEAKRVGFLRGTKREGNPEDRELRAPESGHGYTGNDLYGPLGEERLTSAAVERERQITFAKLHDAVVKNHATEMHGGDGLGNEDTAKARAEELTRKGNPHTVVKMGHQYAVMPDFLAKRLTSQLRQPGKPTMAARWATRTAIRATLPFSMAWHAGNTVDLMTRLALSTPPGTAMDGVQATKALEVALDKLDPDLRHHVLDAMKGHFGTRRTVRDPRASDFLPGVTTRKISDAVGNFMKATGGRVVDRGFKFSSDIESQLVKPAIGSHALDFARNLGHSIDDIDKAMEKLADDLHADPQKVIELQDRILGTVGDFATKSPNERFVMNGVDVFWTWLRESTKFVLKTLPEKHPKRTAMLFIAASMTAEERARAGFNYYFDEAELDKLHADLGYKPQRDGYHTGGLAGEGTVRPFSGMTSFGEVGANILEPSRLAGRIGSYVQRPVAAGMGYWRTPAEVGLKGLPDNVPLGLGKGETSDLKFGTSKDPTAPRDRAANLALESALPGAKQFRQVAEKGGTPLAGSGIRDAYRTIFQGAPSQTVKQPDGEPPNDYADALHSVMNPFRKQAVRGDKADLTGQQIRDREPVELGEMFPFEMPDGRIVYLRRTQ